MLQSMYPAQLDIKLTLWKRSAKMPNLRTQLPFTSLHFFKNRLLLLYVASNNLHAAYFNQNFVMKEAFVFQTDHKNMYLDLNFLHPQMYLMTDSIFFMCNYSYTSLVPIYYADLREHVIYNFRITNKLQFRTNYSLTLHSDFEFYLFGGFDDQMRLTNHLEAVNITHCEIVLPQSKGNPPSPRHSHFAHATSKNLIIAGGSQSTNLFERAYLQDLFVYDFGNQTWQQLKVNIPKHIGFGNHV